MEKQFYIHTYGCQANIRDSQIMAGTLEALGFVNTENYEKADVIIINTCSVRQGSEDKVFGWGMKLGSGYKSKDFDKKGKQLIFVTGCMIGSAKGDRQRTEYFKLVKQLKWADYLLAPKEEHTIPNILVKEGMLEEWALQRIPNQVEIMNPDFSNDTEWAYINISTGCDNFCTFCVVPYARGEEKSRSEKEILSEVKHLTNRGYENIMLVGQNVNSWGLDRKTKFKIRANSEDKIPFANLLKKIHDIDQVKKINFISSNPFDFTLDLIETLRLPKIEPYLHLAVQSGNNEILKLMNRRHTIEDFKDLVKNIKQASPNMKFGTDIIVGFPNETKEQFLDTVQLFKEVQFHNAYISIYSPREGTNAQKYMKDNVPIEEKKRRHKVLTEVWKDTKKV